MANALPIPVLKFTDSTGAPLVGGKLYSYAAGTNTPLATYTDASAIATNPNPTILGADGSCQAWVKDLAYKLVLKDSNDVTLWTVDNVITLEDGSITTAKLADGSVTTLKIADGAVTVTQMGPASVGTTQIIDASVTNAKMASASVATANIIDHAVTNAKLAVGSVPGMTMQQLVGSGTTVVPAGVTMMIALGAGGGGGGGAGGVGVNAAGGGGGAASPQQIGMLAVTPGETLTYAVGAGGAGGVPATSNGSPGGDTQIHRTSAGRPIYIVYVPGGAGGGTASGTSIGIGGKNNFVGSISGGDGGAAGIVGSPVFAASGLSDWITNGGSTGGLGDVSHGGSGGGAGGGSSGGGTGGYGGSCVAGGVGNNGAVATGPSSGGGGGAGGSNGNVGGSGGTGTAGYLFIAYSTGV